MKIHFESNLDYQDAAVEAVCDIFKGQDLSRSEFTVTPNRSLLPEMQDGIGYGNWLRLSNDTIKENLHAIQLRNGLPPSEELTYDFTVEMETGTGKTYVYLRTILELNKRYGFTKFIIVVPSIAIKEGVKKTLDMTREHFKALYSGVHYEYFIYDSSKLGQVRYFATTQHVQIMIVTVGAINKKDVNNIYGKGANEQTGGEAPIELIRRIHPILIIDEPQSVDGGLAGEGKKALSAMNPLCTLRYSATHVEKYNMLYKLDAVDAYERKLVKQIEVASANVENAHNKPYVRMIDVTNKRGVFSAKVELDVQTKDGVQRRVETVQPNTWLGFITERDIYSELRVGEISVKKGSEWLELHVPGGSEYLRQGQEYGGLEPLTMQREMIRRTIKEHLDKEMRLRPQGIKVLSLFFIDSVARYRGYDEQGNVVKGDYATIFEEEYRRYIKHPDYQTLFEGADTHTDATQVHEGYFSIDKKGGWTETSESNQSSRENAERAYNLIMRDKEKLLSFETPLKFIFSHSALREGWDNPNIFQICALREIGTEHERRQTIGRGLRLCVNQQGERVHGFESNTLTVIATESYEQFAEKLQREFEEDTGIRFGVVEEHQFAGIAIQVENGEIVPLGFETSKQLWQQLKDTGYIDAKGRVQDLLRVALKEKNLSVSAEFLELLPQITKILQKAAGRLEVKDADKKVKVNLRQAQLDLPEFKELWERIKHKTTYRVAFDNEKLIESCIYAIKKAPPVIPTRLQWRKAELAIGQAGVGLENERASIPQLIEEDEVELPDILTILQDKTQLKRRSIARILIESKRLDDFKRNPQQFIDITARAIKRAKQLAIVDGIKYQKLGKDFYYCQELFKNEELFGYLEKNMVPVKHSVYDHIVYDSTTERDFALQLDNYEGVKVYTKLPVWFKVPTPLGTYNPDWAVVIDDHGASRLYFVTETKSGLFSDEIRLEEQAKVDCGKAHFNELANGIDSPARFRKATRVEDIFVE